MASGTKARIDMTEMLYGKAHSTSPLIFVKCTKVMKIPGLTGYPGFSYVSDKLTGTKCPEKTPLLFQARSYLSLALIVK